MAKNQNNNVAPATQKTEPEAKKDALATALAQIENLVRCDDLTGIANRRGVMEALQRHQAQARHSGQPLPLSTVVPMGERFRRA